MPFYEYDCPACGACVEVLQKMDEPPPRTCPACGQEATLRRRLSAASVGGSAPEPAPCGAGAGAPGCGAGACPACLPD